MAVAENQLPEIRTLAGQVTEPELGRSLADLEMLGDISLDADGTVRIEIRLPSPAWPEQERIGSAIVEAVSSRFPDQSVEVTYSTHVRGKNSGGTIGLRIKNVIAVGSGKGGVGKSTIAACLAFGLQSRGARVGLMDADVYGPSLPHMLGASGQPAASEIETDSGQKVARIQPIVAQGLKVMSMGFFIDPDRAVVWRGPMLHKALTQFLKDTEWGELDYLIIDLPPGTGDVSLTLSQLLGLAGAVVVCTPQQVALLDAVKAISMYQQVKVPVLGIVENMSGEVFGRGGARDKAEELGVPFLGEVPMEASIRMKGDEGVMGELFGENSPSRDELMQVCEQVAVQVVRQLIDSPDLPSLEIL